LVANGDERAFSQALLELIDDPAGRQRMGAAAFETAQTYSPDQVARRWLDVFEAALQRRAVS
jgi:glycosyltransferase involved in cell wall biosynthesis